MIKTDALTKRFGPLTAVDELSFECQPGEVLGFLGPNGAGKSTTMKMIAGFVPPTAGRAEVCGFDVVEQPLEAKRRLGYLPEGAPSYAEMTPLSVLEFVADVRGMQGGARRGRLEAVVDQLNLHKVLHQPFETLSKGFKRRVGLAQSLLHDPEVLILDEPTDGLDPNQKHEVRELILSMAADKLIVISTHILEEVEAVCNRAIIISDGRILADDTPENLAARSRYHNAVRLMVDDNNTPAGGIEDALSSLDEVAAVERDADGHIIALARDGAGAPLAAIAQLAAARQWNITDLRAESGRLNEVFRDITGGQVA